VIRVRPEMFKRVETSAREVGARITLVDGRRATVLDVGWHHNRGEPMYSLCVEGKKKSKRYWESDFIEETRG
jgi:hypothetical protein